LQSRHYQDDLVKGQNEYQLAAIEWQRENQVQLNEQAQAQAQIQALQNQILDMDDALETTQQNLMTVQDDSRVQEEDMRAALVREQRRVEHVREELRAVEATRDELQELQNQTQAWEESTEIAKAAVAAAARREAVLLQEWQDFVTTNYTRVQTEKEGFKQQVDELVLQRDNAPPTAGGTPNMSDSDSDSKPRD
jgi:chromosome segregation ATPase